MKKWFFLLASLSGMILFCGGPKEDVPGWRGSITEENGLIVVKNPGQPIHEGQILLMEEDLSVPSERAGEYYLGSVRSVAVDEEEAIFLLDGKESDVKVFDRDGRWLRTFGSKGQGPGEMQGPGEIFFDAQGAVMIHDPQARKMLWFSKDGAFLRQQPTAYLAFGRLHPLGESGRYLFESLPPPIFGEELLVLDRNFELIKRIYKGPDHPEMARPPYKNVISKPGLLSAAMPSGDFIWGFSDTYELREVNPQGETVRIIRAEKPKVKMTDAHIAAYRKKIAFAESVLGPGRRDVEDVFPDHLPEFRDISIDDQGRIYVRTYEWNRYGRYYYDLFDASGRYTAKIDLKAYPYVWENGKMYSVIWDEDGAQILKRYKIIWSSVL